MDYPIKTPAQLGAVVRGFRRDRKMTQRDVGARIGLAQNAISEIESNPGPASLARVFKVLAALDVDLVVRPRKPGSQRQDW